MREHLRKFFSAFINLKKIIVINLLRPQVVHLRHPRVVTVRI